MAIANEIVKGISVALNTAFGDKYEIYQSAVEQGLTEPCFLISVLSPSQTPYLGARRRLAIPLDVHYFPAQKGSSSEMMEIAEQLFAVLEFITLPDSSLVRAIQMNYEIQDGVLHFFITYSVFLTSFTEQTPLKDFSLTSGIVQE